MDTNEDIKRIMREMKEKVLDKIFSKIFNKMKAVLFRMVVKLLASTRLTFTVTFGIIFTSALLMQWIQGLPEKVVEIEPFSLLIIPIAIAMLMVGLRIALIRRYSNIRFQAKIQTIH
jgi:hypothetical protein